MSTETEQQDLGVYKQDHGFLSAVVNYMSENENFRGSATELAKVLGLGISARAVSVELKKLNGELENLGISITWARKRNKRVVTITNTAVVPQNEVTLRHMEETTPRNSGFASHTEKEPITFPFSWQYATIEPLTEEKKIEINRIQHNGRKHYQKTCSLCGKEGNLEYRKISDANSALLCKHCAESYIISAVKLINEGVGGDALE